MPAGLFTKRRVIWISCIIATIILGAAILWPAPTPVSEPLPSPNGYDDFVRAGTLLVPISSDYKKLPLEQLRALVKTNQETLRLVRLGLGRECRKPVEYTRTYLQTIVTNLDTIRQLARLRAAEGFVAEQEGHYRNAALSYCDSIKLGVLSAKGGLVIDHLVGIICETIGSEGIKPIIVKLSAHEAGDVLSKIIEADRAGEKPEDFIARDLVFTKSTRTISERLHAILTYKTLTPGHVGLANYRAKAHRHERQRRELIIRLAMHIYKLEKGTPPRQMSDLVPNILPTIPVDPETGTNLVLNPSK